MAAVNSIEGISSQGSPTVSLATQYEYISKPLPPLQKSLCKIFRRKHFGGFLDLGSHYYEMYIEGTNTARTFLLSGLKKKKAKTSTYLISLTKFDCELEFKKGIIGKVKSNFLGTVFTIYDSYHFNDRADTLPLSFETLAASASPARLAKSSSRLCADREMAIVTYEPNLLGLNGPRRVAVILPAITADGRPRPTSLASELSLHAKFKREEHADLLVLRNKVPQWSEETQSYVLNFHGRVTHASVKNFQLVHEDDYDYIAMQFGRIGTDAFTIDFQYPISAFMAFAVAMTSFDDKLACE